MHLYSIVETVLYMFYEAILNKSVFVVFCNGNFKQKYSLYECFVTCYITLT